MLMGIELFYDSFKVILNFFLVVVVVVVDSVAVLRLRSVKTDLKSLSTSGQAKVVRCHYYMYVVYIRIKSVFVEIKLTTIYIG